MEKPNRSMESDLKLVNAVLDTLIPASEDGTKPGAGSLDLSEAIREASGDFWPGVLEGIRSLEAEARKTGASGFEALSLSDRSELLSRSQESHPGVLQSLVFQCYMAYYRHPKALEALGLEARPPFPDGFDIEDFDPALLDPVRRRPPFYRKVD